MKAKNEVFNSIRTARNNRDALADEVVKAESAVAIAQEIMEKEEIDDGVTAPEVIFERSEAARRELSIRKIQANRVIAKLTEAEMTFGALILDSTELIQNLLDKRSDEAYEQLKAKISPMVGLNAAASHEFDVVISLADPVKTRSNQCQLIAAAKIPSNTKGSPTPALIEAILNSEPLI